MSAQDRAELLRARLAALQPDTLEIIDESHMHAGHAGAQTGASHFRVRISCAQFNGKLPLARHRLVYDLVQDLIPHPIHALAIDAKPSSNKGNT
ncbi:BolA family transcriptional regulator [Pusillimonas sp. CC-YST705]|uniref:BolA family transcriptional regulator n=1 Tax=Mesopusillimonas faecipullorum TaxID=2755040 RepID=A0ABS8CA11_9BURK|nr:BolA family protein [Mesopusillimonas faecipullorum]MCB5362469.1 BolA family transcriptional regulator [Mesopusillimonas faecipullorum]